MNYGQTRHFRQKLCLRKLLLRALQHGASARSVVRTVLWPDAEKCKILLHASHTGECRAKYFGYVIWGLVIVVYTHLGNAISKLILQLCFNALCNERRSRIHLIYAK